MVWPEQNSNSIELDSVSTCSRGRGYYLHLGHVVRVLGIVYGD